jgi:protein SCO1/2
MKKQKVTVILVSFFILLGAAFSFYYYYASKEIKKPKVAIQSIPGQSVRPFSFINQEGDTITRKVMDGKVAVIEYFYTTCKSICPKMNENMAKVYQAFRNSNDVIILSHTVDPLRDSVAAMKAYSLRFDADPEKWIFLTGDKKALYDQARYSYGMGVVDTTAEDISEDFIHTNIFVLVDKQGRLRMHLNKDGNPEAYDGTSEKSVHQMIEDIKYLQEEK